MKRLLIAVITVAGLAAVSAGTTMMAQGWTDTHTTSGNVSASTTPDLLYIRDSSGPGNCGSGDDSGADEVIFDTPTQLPLLPDGPPAEASICLQNISLSPWEITGIVPTFTKTSDPGGICTATPVLDLAVWDDAAVADDPSTQTSSALPWVPYVRTNWWLTIHVAPSQSEQIRVHVSLPPSLPAECQGVTWSLSIAWTATIV